MAANEQACSMWARVTLAESREDRVRDLLWQPPTPKFRCGEVGKRRRRGKYQTPRFELVGEPVRLPALDVEAIRHPAPAEETSMAAERLLTWFLRELHA